jgi:hypothetical protein
MEQQQVGEALAVGLDRRPPAVLGLGRSEVCDAPAEQPRAGDDGGLKVSLGHDASREADQAKQERRMAKAIGA